MERFSKSTVDIHFDGSTILLTSTTDSDPVIEFHRVGSWKWNAEEHKYASDPSFEPKSELMGKLSKKQEQIYCWVLRDEIGYSIPPSIIYVGMTTNSITERLGQHIVGMRGPLEGSANKKFENESPRAIRGLNRAINTDGSYRTKGAGSISGGKKRLFFQRMQPSEIEIYTCPVLEIPGHEDWNLHDLESVVIAMIQEYVDLKSDLNGRHWLRLNGTR